MEQEQGSDTDCSTVVSADIFWSSEYHVLPVGSYLPWCGFPCAVWHVWAPAEPPWVSLGLHQLSSGGCCPAEKVAEFLHPDGESDGTGSSTRSQGVTELPG